MRVVNLSRRPFVNDRPVVRLSILLWVTGTALLAANIYSYTNYWIDSAEIRAELAEIESEIDREQASFSDIKRRFQSLELAAMNKQATFLNALIRDRTFPWSLLFEDLEDVLPFDVKLGTVRPEPLEDSSVVPSRAERRASSRRRSSQAPPPPPPATEEVTLSLQGSAKTGEAILEFVDALFDDPAFRQPRLLREGFVEQTGLTSFEVRVLYRIKTAPEGAVEAADGEDDVGPAEGAAEPRTEAGDPEEITVGPRAPEATATGAGERPPPTGDARSSEPGSSARRAAAGEEPTRTLTSIPPARGSGGRPAAVPPSTGRPSAAGAAGRPAPGTVLVRRPTVTPPPPQAGPEPEPRASQRRGERLPPAAPATGDEAPSADTPAADDPGDRPRFVEPSASDAARLGGSGGSRP